MKVNLILTVIMVLLSALIAYAFYHFHKGETKLILAIVSFIYIITTLVVTGGISLYNERASINIKIISFIFFIIGLILNFIFMLIINFSIPLYIILNGLFFLFYISISYGIGKAKQ